MNRKTTVIAGVSLGVFLVAIGFGARWLLETGAFLSGPEPPAEDTFIRAIGRNDLGTVRTLLSQGLNPNLRSPEPYSFVHPYDPTERKCEPLTALMLACHKGKLEIARALLEAGADPNARSRCSEASCLPEAGPGRNSITALLIARKWIFQIGPNERFPREHLVNLLLSHGAKE